MLKPVMPFIDYYVNYNYISTTLCVNRDKPQMHCNGKCYLNKLIKKEINQENNTNSKAPNIDFSKYPVLLIDTEIKVSIVDENISNKIIYYKNLNQQDFISQDFHPPQLV